MSQHATSLHDDNVREKRRGEIITRGEMKLDEMNLVGKQELNRCLSRDKIRRI